MYFVRKILTSPLVWIGFILFLFTVHYEQQDEALSIFLDPIVHRNLAIGSIIYVLLFDKRYTQHRSKISLTDTFFACIETFATILFVWFLFLLTYLSYHESGELYSLNLRRSYSEIKMRNIR